MRRAPRNKPLWIVLGVAGVALAATLVTDAGSHRAVKAVSLDVVPSEVPAPIDAVTGNPVSEPIPGESPLAAPAEETLAPSVVSTTPSTSNRTPSAAEPVGAAGMVVGIDPETGKVGMPSREFRDALRESHGNPAMSRSMEGLQVIHRPDGSRMIDLRGRFQEYTVIRVTPDGRKEQVCVQGPDVEAALRETANASPADADAQATAAAASAGPEANAAPESLER